MAFKKVTDKTTYVKYKECAPGQVLAEGHYVSVKENEYGQTYIIRKPNGEKVGLPSSGKLKYAFNNDLILGDYVRITYNGMERIASTKFKGKLVDTHQFDIEVDEERRNSSIAAAQVAPASVASNSASSDEYADDEEESVSYATYSDDDSEVEAVETVVAKAAEPILSNTPKQKMTAQELLKKIKSKA
jgi:hypothetical protein